MELSKEVPISNSKVVGKICCQPTDESIIEILKRKA